MRLKTLNGAPLSEHLDFSDNTLLSHPQSYSFSAILDPIESTADSISCLKWRCITSRSTRLQTGWSQPYLPGNSTHFEESGLPLSIPNVAETSCYIQEQSTILDATVTPDDPSLNTDGFFQQSLLFHDALLSSQVLQATANGSFGSPSSFLDTSFTTTISNLDSPYRVNEHALLPQVSPQIAIASLGSLPTAQQLNAMYPQTLTPNFLCVLTASPVQREILVQKSGQRRTLWEMFVADDTQSNFKINFWIPPPRKSQDPHAHVLNELRQVLDSIKAGDILLLRNIALNSFRDRVYGQSLSPALTRAHSSLDLLMKSNGVEVTHTESLPPAALAAFLRVRRWARTHVVSEATVARKRQGSASEPIESSKRALLTQNHHVSLPPDTMESV